MKTRAAKIVVALVCGAFAAAAAAQDRPAGSPERGLKAYIELLCSSCHGTVGQGGAPPGGGPKLTPNPFPYAAFALQLRKPRLDMPAYTEKWVSDQEMADMYAYLLSIKQASAQK